MISLPIYESILTKKIYMFPFASLGLVDAGIIGGMLHTYPQLTFCDDIKS
jgi:hypothetical protein